MDIWYEIAPMRYIERPGVLLLSNDDSIQYASIDTDPSRRKE